MRRQRTLSTRSTLAARLATAAASLLLFAGSGGTNPINIDEQTMAKVDDCVKSTYEAFKSNSNSLCVGATKYYDSGGNTGSTTARNRYTLDPPDWDGYSYVPGSGGAHQIGGLCVHDLFAVIESPKQFLCLYHTRGCGLTKGGGHVRGYCTVSIEYTPRDGDVAQIKRYCLSKFSGGTLLPMPKSNPVGCTLP
jgi:hypothetical protein